MVSDTWSWGRIIQVIIVILKRGLDEWLWLVFAEQASDLLSHFNLEQQLVLVSECLHCLGLYQELVSMVVAVCFNLLQEIVHPQSLSFTWYIALVAWEIVVTVVDKRLLLDILLVTILLGREHDVTSLSSVTAYSCATCVVHDWVWVFISILNQGWRCSLVNGYLIVIVEQASWHLSVSILNVGSALQDAVWNRSWSIFVGAPWV
jgi:hypothetical protein